MAFTDIIKNGLSFKKILTPLGKNVVGIDIGSSSIKVVELEKKRGRAMLKTYGEIALGPYADSAIGQVVNLSNEKTAEALRDILKESKTSTSNSGISIPFRSSLVSLIEMPSMPEKQLEEAIPIEARKYIPVPISEITLDWWIIPKDTTSSQREKINSGNEDGQPIKEKSDVLVVSIHNEILSDYNNIVRTNKLNTTFFEIEMFSVIRSLVGEDNSTCLVIDLGAAGTKLYVVQRGILRNSHIISKGSKDITVNLARSLGVSNEQAEKIKRNLSTLNEEDQKSVKDMIAFTVDDIIAEIQNFINSHEHRANKNIDKIILTGGGISQHGLVDTIKSKIKKEVSVGNPFGKVDTPSILSETLKSTGLEFAVAVGIALRKIQELE